MKKSARPDGRFPLALDKSSLPLFVRISRALVKEVRRGRLGGEHGVAMHAQGRRQGARAGQGIAGRHRPPLHFDGKPRPAMRFGYAPLDPTQLDRAISILESTL